MSAFNWTNYESYTRPASGEQAIARLACTSEYESRTYSPLAYYPLIITEDGGHRFRTHRDKAARRFFGVSQ